MNMSKGMRAVNGNKRIVTGNQSHASAMSQTSKVMGGFNKTHKGPGF